MSKALIRNRGETILETDGIVGIDWKTGMPLTGEHWCGGKYTLVDNYVPPVEDEREATYDIVEPVKKEVIEDTPLENVTINEQDGDYIVINGLRYKKV